MAANDHDQLPNSQLHKPRDFSTADNGTEIEKDSAGEYLWHFKYWQRPVISLVDCSQPPPTTNVGDRYVIVEIDSTAIDSGWGEAVINDIVEFSDVDLDGTIDSPYPLTPLAGTQITDQHGKTFAYTTFWKKGNCCLKYYETADVLGTDANTSEKDLASFPLPARALLGGSIEIEAAGFCAATATGKNLRLYFGSGVFDSGTGVINNKDWRIKAKIIPISRFSQKMVAEIMVLEHNGNWSTTSVTSFSDILDQTEDMLSAITIRVAAENAVANANDIVLEYFSVK